MERHEVVRAIVRLTNDASPCKRNGHRCSVHDRLWPCPYWILAEEADRIRERVLARSSPIRSPEDFPSQSPARARCAVKPGMLVQRVERRDDATIKSPIYRVVEVVDDCFCPPYLYELDCPLVYAGSGCPGAGNGCQDCPKVLQPHIHLVLCDPGVKRPRSDQLAFFNRLVQANEETLWELDLEHPTRVATGARIVVLGWAPDYQRPLFSGETRVPGHRAIMECRPLGSGESP